MQASTQASITSKQQMYSLLTKGLLGPTLRSATTLEDANELLAIGDSFAVRTLYAGGDCFYHLSKEQVLEKITTLPLGTWNLTTMLDDRKRVCYGHLYDSPLGWRLHYTTDKTPARLKGDEVEKHLEGLAAKLYLQSVMDQRGWDALTDLLETYPGHIYEFSVMTDRTAARGPSNTIIWEVRTDSGEYERSSFRHGGRYWDHTKPLDGD